MAVVVVGGRWWSVVASSVTRAWHEARASNLARTTGWMKLECVLGLLHDMFMGSSLSCVPDEIDGGMVNGDQQPPTARAVDYQASRSGVGFGSGSQHRAGVLVVTPQAVRH